MSLGITGSGRHVQLTLNPMIAQRVQVEWEK